MQARNQAPRPSAAGRTPWPVRAKAWHRPLAAAALLLALATPGLAQESGDRVAGRRIAETWCANCHVIGPEAAGRANDAAPTFHAVAGMASTTALSLHVFLQTPHARMPNYQLSRAEMDDVIAYVLSLRGR